MGGTVARGRFLVFLDAHVKPHPHWLDPMVPLLEENPKRILNMQVGLLDGATWQEMPGGVFGSKAAFKWDLNVWAMVY